MISKNISVVITTKDRPQDLRNALISLSEQTTLPGEVVIVDDGSNQKVSLESLEVLRRIGIPVYLIRNESSVGAAKARNLGVSIAKKEFIAFLDDDDMFRSEKIAVIDDTIEQNRDIDLIYHRANVKLVNEYLEYETKYRKGQSGSIKEIVISNYIGGCSLVVCKKSVLLKVGLFDEELPACEDWDLWIRCIRSGAKEFFINRVLTDYFSVSGSKSLSQNLKNNEMAKLRIKQKYADVIDTFTPKEKRRSMECDKTDDLQRYLLADEYCSSLRCAFKIFKITKTFTNFIKLVAVLLGTKNALRFRSLI